MQEQFQMLMQIIGMFSLNKHCNMYYGMLFGIISQNAYVRMMIT